MPDCSIDAIKIAKAIQKDELSILRGKEFKMRDRIKKRKRMKKTRKKKSKYTLDQVGTKLDQIGEDLAKLTKYVTEGFKRIDTRLDYIVKANNLKDLPKTK